MKTIVMILVLLFMVSNVSAGGENVYAYDVGTYTAHSDLGDGGEARIYVAGGGSYYAEISTDAIIYANTGTYAHPDYTEVDATTKIVRYNQGSHLGTSYPYTYYHHFYTSGSCIVRTCPDYYLNTAQLYTAHSSTYIAARSYAGGLYKCSWCSPYSDTTLTVTLYKDTPDTSSGTTNCTSYVDKYINASGTYQFVERDDTSVDEYYEFDIFDGAEYKLVFSDDATYEFTCEGNEVYNYDGCMYMRINLKDYCGNTMTNTSVDIYQSDSGAPATYEFVGNYHRINPIEILVNHDVDEGKMLDIYFDTDMGTYHQIEYCIEQTIDILHPLKWWAMTFEAYDVDTELPIENMRITVNQSCVIDPTHPLKQYLFTGADGKGTFIGLSASVLSVMQGHPEYMGEAGYTNFDINPFGDAFCTYWSIGTYFNKSSGEDYQGNVSKDCNIHFKDQNGYVDNHINDTDTYVDLYYDNGNCSATLKFQRLYGTYWMSKMTWNIPINESGYKRIYNVNFSEYDANYRGYMYATECSCNSTIPLYVANETVQEEQHYENLSTYIRFRHQMGASQIDYRSPVEIATYAYTNTSAYLLNINLTLYEQTTQIATIALDWADFAGASPKWYYTWAPTVNYDIGKNYTVVMTGYNGLNLGADDVWTSNIRNNKLTICVKDNHGTPINYATVFVEGWGSQPLESSTDIEITGFDNGDTQYKATKSGYTSSGWATVTFNNDDETVTCILIKESTTRVTGYKLRNDEIKDFFIPVMYLLLMFMLIGAFFHVAGKR